MKKSITGIVLVFTLLVIASCTKHKCPTSIETEVEERMFYQEGYDYLKNVSFYERYYYDDAGKLVSCTAQDTIQGFDKAYKYYYDVLGKIIRIDYFKDGLLSVKSDFNYWPGGRIRTTVQRDNSGNVFATNYYETDSAGLVYRREQHEVVPVFPLQVLYTYNMAGKLTKQDFYLLTGMYLGKGITTYNSDYMMIARDQYDNLDNHIMHIEVTIGANKKREILRRYEPVSFLRVESKCYYEPGHAELTETEIEFINQTYISTGVY
ncbi:MAG: hypothetical protein CVV21_04790 [Candidatus Goldiibacteriota bacterium HGW-Goldbacteria-1]|jgi:hypothetical protein|nr:MAG: hypothetical protein CVV21_04790 [Candidatus Goldiibacteriota bacterium HGW-Goldbacteria-1]